MRMTISLKLVYIYINSYINIQISFILLQTEKYKVLETYRGQAGFFLLQEMPSNSQVSYIITALSPLLIFSTSKHSPRLLNSCSLFQNGLNVSTVFVQLIESLYFSIAFVEDELEYVF